MLIIQGSVGVLVLLGFLSVYIQESNGWSLNPLSWFKRSGGCRLNLNSDLNHKHEPVFLTKHHHGFELAMPEMIDEEGVIKLSKGDKLFVACPGKGNEILGFDALGSQSSVESKCVVDKTLKMNGKEIKSSDLECKNKVFSTLKETDKECGNNAGEEIQLGYEVEGWHPLVSLCYYRSRVQTLHASHLLFGSALQGAEIMKHKTYFIKGPKHLYPGVNPVNAYKQANQREVLSQLLGETRSNYLLARCYLVRGHLAPDGDFLLGAWQQLTYFYVNTAPQWQAVNVGNWLRVESLVRSFASKAQQDFVVTTGTYGILEIDNDKGLSKKIYLEPKQELIPVPSVFWKVLNDPNKKECIVFLVHNNPFLEKKPPTLCKNICRENGWPTNNMEDLSCGYTYCCSYADFKNVIDYAPELDCKRVLKNVDS